MKCDNFFLSHAFKLAKLGRFTTSPNPNVGCVIVKNGNIVGEGYHKKTGGPHAEIFALRMSKKLALGSTVYVTLEPCSHNGLTPPCTEELIKAGVKRVVASISDPNPKISGQGFYQLKNAGIEVKQGLMINEAEKLNKGFFKRMRTGIPWIRLKIAMSLDGKTAISSGDSKWITSFESRKDVQCWRAKSDAILSTSSTIISDNPNLTVRWNSLSKNIKKIYPKNKFKNPIRIIIDSKNKITQKYKIITDKNKTLLARIMLDNIKWPISVEQIKLPKYNNSNKKHINLVSLMYELGNRKINNLWIESGSNLASSLLSLKLIDELIIYQSPILLGIDSYPLFLIKNIKQIIKAPRFKLINIKKINQDIRLLLKPTVNI